MAKHSLRDKRNLKDNLDRYKDEEKDEKQVEKSSYEMSPSEWFEWFVTTEEYKKIKTPKNQTSPNSAGETGLP